jgi:hypothetical protein
MGHVVFSVGIRCGDSVLPEAETPNSWSGIALLRSDGDVTLGALTDPSSMPPLPRSAPLLRLFDSKRFAWGAVGLLMLVQGIMFMQGYRLSADDAGFLQSWMDGRAAIWEAASAAARSHGRIGMYLMWPLNVFAAYAAGFTWLRLCFVALYFAIFPLFACYMSRLLKRDLTIAVVLLLLVAHPLALEHMPPNAYALQNTLPVFAILLSRVILDRVRGRSPTLARRLVAGACLTVFALAMLVSEYALMFGAALVLAEAVLAASASDGNRNASWRAWGKALFRRSLADLSIVAGVLALYLLFRQMNPSSYDGNQLDGLWHPGRIVITALAHLASGSIIPRLGLGLIHVPAGIWMAALGYGAIACLAARSASRQLPRLPSPAIVALAALSLGLLMTLPLAMTAKQQAWCLEGGICGYLDSRIAYLWLGLCLLGLVAWCRRTTATWLPPVAFDRGFAGLAGVLAVLGFAHNWQLAERMGAISMAWQRADAIACDRQGTGLGDERFRVLIDPRNLVALHPGVDAEDYWRRYLAWRSRGPGCPGDIHARKRRLAQLIQDPRGPSGVLTFGTTVRFAAGHGDQVLYANWSPEPWGVWSTGKQANLKVRLPTAKDGVYFEFKALRYVPPKSRRPVRIIVNGEAIASADIGAKAGHHRLLIPRAVLERSSDGITDIAVLVEDASSPKLDGTNQDPRTLGIGLIEMTFVAAPAR